MQLCVSKQELEAALKSLNTAIDNGFKDSLAVLRVYTGGECIDDFLAKAAGVILKAHPTSPSKNWGHTDHPEWQMYKNGKYVEI